MLSKKYIIILFFNSTNKTARFSFVGFVNQIDTYYYFLLQSNKYESEMLKLNKLQIFLKKSIYINKIIIKK